VPGSRHVLYRRAAEDAPLLFGLFDIDVGVRITPDDEDLTRELLQSFDVLPRWHPRSQRNIEAWLDRLRTKGFWLVEDDVFGPARASMRKHES
jgi:hypothetical protein